MTILELSKAHVGKRFRVKLHEEDAYMDVREETESDTYIYEGGCILKSETRTGYEVLLLSKTEVFEI